MSSYAKSPGAVGGPDIMMCQVQIPSCSLEVIPKSGLPTHGWSMVAGLAQPKSQGRVHLRSSDPFIAPMIDLNALSHPEDLNVAKTAVNLSREIGKGAASARARLSPALRTTSTLIFLSVTAQCLSGTRAARRGWGAATSQWLARI
jgi:choline dehydrogenase-like flavoprotein